jgi:AraC family transcriptional regulator of adaptative response / DNA-3-methyladenine glycosylase II
VVAHGGGYHWLRCRFSTDQVVVSAPTIPRAAAARLARRIFDLDTDLDPFLAQVGRDRILGPLVKSRPGLRRLTLLDPFEATVRAIAGQLVSVAAATTLVTRLVARYGPAIESGGRAFPGPARVLGAGRAIGQLGFPATKVAAMLGVARAVVEERLDWAQLALDHDLADRTLLAIRGIGPWTSAYIRWRALGDLDAFPETDLGIIQALAKHGVARRDVGRVAERWRPWRGLAVGHLWASLSA